MACNCDSDIRACAPYANVHDVRNVLESLCDPCYTTVPNGTDPEDFITTGFGSEGYGECCEFILVEVLGADPETDPSVFYLSSDAANWYQITAAVTTCTVELPDGTLKSNFLTAGWSGTAPTNCNLLAVQYEDGDNTQRLFLSANNAADWWWELETLGS